MRQKFLRLHAHLLQEAHIFFFFKKIGNLLLTFLSLSAVIFLSLEGLAGNAAEVQLGMESKAEVVARLAQEMGLNQSFLVRYGKWLRSLLSGQLQTSVIYRENSADLLQQRLQVTAPLAGFSMMVTLFISGMLAILITITSRPWVKKSLLALCHIGMCIPNFWLAIVLILTFSIHWPWLPAGGFPGWGQGLFPALKAFVLPIVSLSFAYISIMTSMARASLLEVLHAPFIRTAEAKGLSKIKIFLRHVLRNALSPILALAMLQCASLVTGTILIENIFHLPGLGQLLFQAVTNRDVPLIRDLILFFTLATMFLRFLGEILAGFADPRLQEQKRGE